MKRNLLIVGIVATLILAVSFYTRKHQSPAKQSVEKVSLRLGWIPQAEFAGAYVALDKGYFKENGLDVTINPGGVDLNPVRQVASGSDTFGLTEAEQLIIARSKDVPVVAVAATFQKSPVVFMAKKSSEIKRPEDFTGKTVGIKVGTGVETIYRALLNKQGINSKQIKEVPVQFDLSPFFSDQVNVWPSYIINEPLIAQKEGVDINIVDPSDYGIRSYADVLFVSENTLQQKSDLVKRFTNAYIRGWQYSVQDPEEAINILAKNAKGIDKKQQLEQMKAVIKLVTTNVGEEKIGSMDKKVWQTAYQFLDEQKQLKKAFSVSAVFNTDVAVIQK